jgi:hypothetical protein
VLKFHDSTLEASADDILVIGRHTTVSEAVADMSVQVSS